MKGIPLFISTLSVPVTPPAPPKVISETWFLTLSVPDTPSGRSVEPAINSSPNAGLVTVYSMFVMGSWAHTVWFSVN